MGAIRSLIDLWQIRQDPVRWARSQGVRVGEDCDLIGVTRLTFGSEPYLVSLGDRVSVATGVSFVTHDGGVRVFRREHPEVDVIAPITIGNNVFIGLRSIILAGVTVGDNSVIGAGSVVTRDVLPGTVCAGVPAKPLKTIDEYWAKSVAPRMLPFAMLSPEEKRRKLQTLYPNNVGAAVGGFRRPARPDRMDGTGAG
jgi:acetyltransferase-like isoleucine patch superfamily enzyme